MVRLLDISIKDKQLVPIQKLHAVRAVHHPTPTSTLPPAASPCAVGYSHRWQAPIRAQPRCPRRTPPRTGGTHSAWCRAQGRRWYRAGGLGMLKSYAREGKQHAIFISGPDTWHSKIVQVISSYVNLYAYIICVRTFRSFCFQGLRGLFVCKDSLGFSSVRTSWAFCL